MDEMDDMNKMNLMFSIVMIYICKKSKKEYAENPMITE